MALEENHIDADERIRFADLEERCNERKEERKMRSKELKDRDRLEMKNFRMTVMEMMKYINNYASFGLSRPPSPTRDSSVLLMHPFI